MSSSHELRLSRRIRTFVAFDIPDIRKSRRRLFPRYPTRRAVRILRITRLARFFCVCSTARIPRESPWERCLPAPSSILLSFFFRDDLSRVCARTSPSPAFISSRFRYYQSTKQTRKWPLARKLANFRGNKFNSQPYRVVL